MKFLTKATLGTALAASALVSASPAMARDYYGYRHNDNTAAVAVGAGVIGLALGAIIASSSNHNRDDRYYERRGYAYGNGYNTDGWYYRDGYYWDRDGRRYDRDDYNRYRGDRDGYRGDWRGDRDGWRR